eukprot:8234239-Alexandrium_andersonii.AAC.1
MPGRHSRATAPPGRRSVLPTGSIGQSRATTRWRACLPGTKRPTGRLRLPPQLLLAYRSRVGWSRP